MVRCVAAPRTTVYAALAVALTVAGSAAGAQGGGGQQQPYENLKFFSKDTPRD
jgi:hypothetical protein